MKNARHKAIVVFVALSFVITSHAQDSDTKHGVFEAQISKSVQIEYLVYVPKGYNSNDAWPMLVYLHGGGLADKGLEALEDRVAQSVIPHIQELPMILLAPSLPGNGTWQPDELIALIDKVSLEVTVDQDRLYLSGLSRGGNGAWKLGAAHGDRFAVVAPMAGRGIHSVCRIKPAKVRIFHGSADTVVPLASSESMKRNLEGCEADVELTIYPDVGHNSQSPTFENPEFWAWLLAQSRD